MSLASFASDFCCVIIVFTSDEGHIFFVFLLFDVIGICIFEDIPSDRLMSHSGDC